MYRKSRRQFYCAVFVCLMSNSIALHSGGAFAQNQSHIVSRVDRDNLRKETELLEQSIRQNPEDYILLYRLGKRKESNEDLQGALSCFLQSLKVNPLQSDVYATKTTADRNHRTMRSWAYQDIGYIYCLQGRTEEGIAALSHAIKLRPDYAGNYLNRAVAYRKIGQLTKSHEDKSKANYLQSADVDDECRFAPMTVITEEEYKGVKDCIVFEGKKYTNKDSGEKLVGFARSIGQKKLKVPFHDQMLLLMWLNELDKQRLVDWEKIREAKVQNTSKKESKH